MNIIKALGRVGVPSWWDRVTNPADPSQGYGFGFDTHQKALDYLKLSQKYYQAKINLFNYQCSNYPKDPVFCQHSAQHASLVRGWRDQFGRDDRPLTGLKDYAPRSIHVIPQTGVGFVYCKRASRGRWHVFEVRQTFLMDCMFTVFLLYRYHAIQSHNQ